MVVYPVFCLISAYFTDFNFSGKILQFVISCMDTASVHDHGGGSSENRCFPVVVYKGMFPQDTVENHGCKSGVIA